MCPCADTPDLIAVQQLLRADEEAAAAFRSENSEGNDEEADREDGEDEGGGAEYENLLQLGARIGDVKAERWAFRAQNAINALAVCTHDSTVNSTYGTM